MHQPVELIQDAVQPEVTILVRDTAHNIHKPMRTDDEARFQSTRQHIGVQPQKPVQRGCTGLRRPANENLPSGLRHGWDLRCFSAKKPTKEATTNTIINASSAMPPLAPPRLAAGCVRCCSAVCLRARIIYDSESQSVKGIVHCGARDSRSPSALKPLSTRGASAGGISGRSEPSSSALRNIGSPTITGRIVMPSKPAARSMPASRHGEMRT